MRSSDILLEHEILAIENFYRLFIFWRIEVVLISHILINRLVLWEWELPHPPIHCKLASFFLFVNISISWRLDHTLNHVFIVNKVTLNMFDDSSKTLTSSQRKNKSKALK